MNLTGKLDLDRLLGAWPAPSSGDDAEWEARAARITQAALTRPAEGEAALAAVLSAPPLEPEPGERSEAPARTHGNQSRDMGRDAAVAGPSGEAKMSQGSDEQERKSTEERSSITSAPSRKRGSLKELAERASQTGLAGPAGRVSVTSTPPPSRTSGIATPLPPAIATPIPSATATPLPSRPGSMPPRRANEAGKEDSGVINLRAVTESATPEQKAAAEKAQPGSADLSFEEDAAPASSEAKARKQPAAPVPLPAKKKGGGGVWAGVAIAVVGLAASFAIIKMRSADTPGQATQDTRPTPELAAGEAPTPAQPTASPGAEQPAAGEPAPGAAPEKPAQEGRVAHAPAGEGAAAPAEASPPGQAVAQAAPPTPGKQPPATPGKPGDLNSAMEKAVGAEGNQAVTEAPEPAAGKPVSQSVPEQPPQGSIQAAIRGAMPGAKACVAGADDVTRAQVTFSSSGAVSSVSVAGWAASNGQAGCVKSALQGANVGPFSKSSFTVPVTIRP